jgi:hypothetical protein
VLTWLIACLKCAHVAGAAGAAKVARKLVAQCVAGAVGIRPGAWGLVLCAKLVAYSDRQGSSLPGSILSVPVQPPLAVSASLQSNKQMQGVHALAWSGSGGGTALLAWVPCVVRHLGYAC